MKNFFTTSKGHQSKNKSHASGMAHTFSRIGRDPYVDWALILFLTFACMVVSISFGVRLFFSVRNTGTDTSAGSSQTSATMLDKSDLYQVIATFNQKNAQTAALQGRYPEPADPSN